MAKKKQRQKKTNNDLQNTTQKAKKYGFKSGATEG